jgi:hypothetical protein
MLQARRLSFPDGFREAVDEAGCPVGRGGWIGTAGLVLAWWVCQELIRLDEGASLGIAGAVLAVVLAVGAWWAPGGADGALGHERTGGAVREKSGDAENTISGGTFSGPALQGRDFSGLSFGASPVAPSPRPKDPEADS